MRHTCANKLKILDDIKHIVIRNNNDVIISDIDCNKISENEVQNVLNKKQQSLPYKHNKSISENIFDLLRINIWGKLSTKNHDEYSYSFNYNG